MYVCMYIQYSTVYVRVVLLLYRYYSAYMRALESVCNILYANDLRTVAQCNGPSCVGVYAVTNLELNSAVLACAELRTEIDQLRSQLQGQPSSMSVLMDTSSSVEVLSLKKQKSEKLVAEATRTWKERLDQAEKRKQEEVDKLKVRRGRSELRDMCGVVGRGMVSSCATL